MVDGRLPEKIADLRTKFADLKQKLNTKIEANKELAKQLTLGARRELAKKHGKAGRTTIGDRP